MLTVFSIFKGNVLTSLLTRVAGVVFAFRLLLRAVLAETFPSEVDWTLASGLAVVKLFLGTDAA